MKKMNSLVALSITTAIFCGMWYALCGPTGLVAWAGFAGCTSYCAAGCHGVKAIKTAVIANLAGVLCGVVTIALGGMFPALDSVGIWTALCSFVICMAAHIKWLQYTTGIFIGCFGTFAIGGDWKLLVPSILAGALLGWICDVSGAWLYRKVSGEAERETA